MLGERDDGLVWVPYPLHRPVRMGREGVSKGKCSRNVSCEECMCEECMCEECMCEGACVRVQV